MGLARRLRVVALAVLATVPLLPLDATAHKSLYGSGVFGGEVAAFGYSPHDSSRVLAATGQGIFRSTDGARTWERATKGLGNTYIDGFVFHPANPDTVYTHPFGYRSRDGGRTWTQRLRFPHSRAGGSGLAFNDSGKNLFAYGLRHLVVSHDEGKSWDFLRSTPGLRYQLCGFAIHPAGRGTLYLAQPYETGAGKQDVALLRSPDGGKTWSRSSVGTCPSQLLVSRDDRNLVFALRRTDQLEGEIRPERSLDGGRTWEVLDTGLSRVHRWVISRSDPRVLYALGSSASSPYGTTMVRSDDRGQTWHEVWSLPYQLYTYRGMLGLEVDPRDPDVVLLGGQEGSRRSVDGGRTFTLQNQGLSATRPTTVAFSRQDPSIIYTTTGPEFYRSRDGGASWEEIGSFIEDVTPFRSPYIHDVEVDALGHVYVSYVPVNARVGDDAQIHRSVDGGDTWERMGDVMAQDLLAHPTIPGFLYAGTRAGLKESKDGGGTWTVPSGLPAHAVADLHLDESTGSVYVLMSSYAAQDPSDNALFRTNAAGQWTAVNYPPFADGYAIAARGPVMYAVGSAYGIARSIDDGETWTFHERFTEVQLLDPTDITIDPLDPNQIVASTEMWGIIWSRDGGESWEPFERMYNRRSGVVEFLPFSPLVEDDVLSARPLFAGIGGLARVIPGPNPEHQAKIEGEVKAGNEVRCETGAWTRADSVSYKWFSGTGALEREIPGATDKTLRVPKVTREVYEIFCRAIGNGPGGRYATTSWVHVIPR